MAATALSWLLLVGWRSIHRSWVTHRRRAGRLTRRTIVIGTDARAFEVIRLFEIHAEAGISVIGVVGRWHEAQHAGRGDRWLGEYRDAARVLAATECETVIVCSADVSPKVLRAATHTEGAGRELLFHPGLSGIDARRVTASPVANEAFLHVDCGEPSKWARAVKRLIDIVVSATLLLIASPVFAAVAIRVRRTDGRLGER